MKALLSDKESFWDVVKVGEINECWLWLGPKMPNGYGSTVTLLGIFTYPHRHAFFLSRGYYPQKGMCVLHKCDNRLCCNPKHLWEGTHKDNMRDMAIKNRSGGTILSDNDVREIISLRKQRKNVNQIARKYGVVRQTLYEIFRGCTKRHMTGGEKIKINLAKKFDTKKKREILAYKNSGLTQKQVSVITNCSQTHISRIWRGEVVP